MIFSTITFLFLFLPATLLLYFLCPGRFKNILLTFLSFTFYTLGEGEYAILMLISIFVNYVSLKLYRISKNKIIYVYIAVIINLSILLIFKYSVFLIYNFNEVFSSFLNVRIEELSIRNPVGISFYVFQSISLLIDYKRNYSQKVSFWDIALYISLFPQLIAGPIVRYKDIANQIKERVLRKKDFVYGIKRFIIGLGKKVLVADVLAVIVADLLSASHNLDSAQSWLCVICFSMQVYYDFSGYSDMAIGLCRMFGFRIPENFRSPYRSKTMQELWSRWHISLTTWFRDYLFNNIRRFLSSFLFASIGLSILINFTLIGFWHGANWCFILFGFFHGIFIVLERKAKIKNTFKEKPIIGVIYSHVIWLTLIPFFIIDEVGEAFNLIWIMYSFSSSSDIQVVLDNEKTFIIVFSLLYAFIPFTKYISSFCVSVKLCRTFILLVEYIIYMIIFILSISRISVSTFNPFIYFQF
jgi:alginate O-acetyltransferase complex protein AlgI